MDCNEVQEKIPEYLKREIANQDLKELQIHFASCKNCSEELENHKLFISRLKTFYVDFDPGHMTNFEFPKEKSSKSELNSRNKVDFPEYLKKLLHFLKPFFIPAVALTIAVVFYSGVFHTKTLSELIWSSLYVTLKSGTVREINSNTVYEKGYQFLTNCKYCSEGDARIEFLTGKTVSFSSKSIFQLAHGEVFLFEGGGKFFVTPKTGGLKVTTENLQIFVVGTEFEVISHGKNTAVHLEKGCLKLIFGKKEFNILSGETIIFSEKYPTGIKKLGLNLWKEFINCNYEVETLLPRLLNAESTYSSGSCNATSASNLFVAPTGSGTSLICASDSLPVKLSNTASQTIFGVSSLCATNAILAPFGNNASGAIPGMSAVCSSATFHISSSSSTGLISPNILASQPFLLVPAQVSSSTALASGLIHLSEPKSANPEEAIGE
ncbi:MAG: FecR domain-containing protein [Candidatus Riflebacteria bacterium]|nr:FecR domain-containing protein [Candidatus Riflebacteria bacterium]